MGHTFWSRLGFWEGLGYLQFEYFKNLSLVFWEKYKKPPKMGVLGLFQAPTQKSRVLWQSFIIKWPPKIIFWDISYNKKPTWAHQKGIKLLLEYACADPQGSQMIAAVGQHGQIQGIGLCPLEGSCWFFMVKNVPKNVFGGLFDNKPFLYDPRF